MFVPPGRDRRGMLLCALLVIVTLAGCDASSRVSTGERSPPAKAVRVAPVERNHAARAFSLTGVTRAASRAQLAFQVSGRLAERPVHIGSEIDKGELIARLNQPELGPAAQAARADVDRLHTELAQAERDLDRVRTLVAEDAATQQELEHTRSRRDGLKAQLARARAQSTRAANMAGELRIEAPLAGTIEQVYVEPGEFVPAGQPVVALSGDRALEVEIGVPESLLSAVHPGDEARLTLPFFDDRAVSGTVTRVARAARGPGSLFSAVITLADDQSLRPGLSVDWHLTSPPDHRLMVPIPAIASPGGTDAARVYRLADGHVDAIPVELGAIVGENVLVSGNLEVGDQVVTVGLNNLGDGRAVRVLDD